MTDYDSWPSCFIEAVSYTHLDVYKRQLYSLLTDRQEARDIECERDRTYTDFFVCKTTTQNECHEIITIEGAVRFGGADSPTCHR